MNLNNSSDIQLKLDAEYKSLTKDFWKFLSYGWPIIELKKFHTKRPTEIPKINEIKNLLVKKLGIIPVYFFLIIIFGDIDYRGPYNNIEKGLLVLYFIIECKSFEEMDKYIPKSTFHQIYRQFYSSEKIEKNKKVLDYTLNNLFSNIKIRLYNGIINNPELFYHVTMHIDGHDTRGIVYGAEDKKIYYSYKLKKNGFRTQVAIDNTGMILFVSDSLPCATNNDGSMFNSMNIQNKINNMDCIALDGGYNLYINNTINNSNLDKHNFVTPIRKDNGIDLSSIELNYNNQFGSFRSLMEKTFADIGHTFERLNNKKPFLTTNINIFNIQLKIACVLINIKKYVALNNIHHSDFHEYWRHDNFDFPYKENMIDNIYLNIQEPKVNERIIDLEKMKLLQKEFLGLNLTDTQITVNLKNKTVFENMEVEENIIDNENYEVEQILDHRGLIVEDSYYLIKWKDYPHSDNSWIHFSKFNETECIQKYWNNKIN